MSPKEFEIKKKELEQVKINAAKMELEFRILEKMQEVDRIKENIKLQDQALDRLQKELQDLKQPS